MTRVHFASELSADAAVSGPGARRRRLRRGGLPASRRARTENAYVLRDGRRVFRDRSRLETYADADGDQPVLAEECVRCGLISLGIRRQTTIRRRATTDRPARCAGRRMAAGGNFAIERITIVECLRARPKRRTVRRSHAPLDRARATHASQQEHTPLFNALFQQCGCEVFCADQAIAMKNFTDPHSGPHCPSHRSIQHRTSLGMLERRVPATRSLPVV